MTRTLKIIVVHSFGLAMLCMASLASAEMFVKYEGIDGEAMGPDGNDDWFVADSFSFGVEREMKESGEKGGTQDINIGLGELQECTLSKSVDKSSAMLAQHAINGKSLGMCEVCLSDTVDGSDTPICYAHYVMERCYVKSWSTSGDADDRPTEEVAFYYNKIAFAVEETDPLDGMNWDNEKNRPWREGLDWLFDFPRR